MQPPSDLRVADAMTLVATLQAATEFAASCRARRAGDDASAEQPAEAVRRHLPAERAELAGLLMHLAASLVAPDDEPEEAVRLRHFDRLLTARRLQILLRTVHQRLLSLYPAVPTSTLETARLLEAEAARLVDLDPEAFRGAASALVAGGLRFVSAAS
jgi:hypothetical protein